MSTTAPTNEPPRAIQLADELSIAGLASRAGSRTTPVGRGTVKYLLTIGDTRFGLPTEKNTIRMREGDVWSCYVSRTGESVKVHCYGGESQQYELPPFDIRPDNQGRATISVIPFQGYHVSPDTAPIQQVLIEDQETMFGRDLTVIKVKCFPPDTEPSRSRYHQLFPRNELYETNHASAIAASTLWEKKDDGVSIALSLDQPTLINIGSFEEGEAPTEYRHPITRT